MVTAEMLEYSHRKLTPAHITFTAAPFDAFTSSTSTWLNEKISKEIDDKKGIHYVANTAIRSGELILKEDPFIRHFEHETRYRYCSYCFRCLDEFAPPFPSSDEDDDDFDYKNIPFDGDQVVECRHGLDCMWLNVYCSEQCESRCWSEGGHGWLCRFYELSEVNDPTVLLALIGYIKSRSFGQNTLPGLVSNRDAVSTSELDTYRQKFNEMADVFYWSDTVVEDLLEIYLQIKCNGFAIKGFPPAEDLYDEDGYELQQSMVQNREHMYYGRGVYLQASRLNHSCKPNSLATFGPTEEEEYKLRRAQNSYGSNEDTDCSPCRLTIHCVKGSSLSAGEEITISYGPLATKHGRLERLQKLRKDYYFDCLCGACTDTHQEKAVDAIYLCQKCKKGRMYKQQTNCPSCKDAPNWTNIAKIEAEADKWKAKGDNQTALQMQKTIYHEEAIPIGETMDRIAQQQCLRGQFANASHLLKQSLQITQKVYGKMSIEAAEEMMKLATVYYNSGQAKDGLPHAKATLIVYRILGLDKTQPDDVEELETMITLFTLNAASGFRKK